MSPLSVLIDNTHHWEGAQEKYKKRLYCGDDDGPLSLPFAKMGAPQALACGAVVAVLVAFVVQRTGSAPAVPYSIRDPSHDHLCHGQLSQITGQLETATDRFGAATRFMPSSVSWGNLAAALSERGHGFENQALEAAAQALDLDNCNELARLVHASLSSQQISACAVKQPEVDSLASGRFSLIQGDADTAIVTLRCLRCMVRSVVSRVCFLQGGGSCRASFG
jgi:hypothetical protein